MNDHVNTGVTLAAGPFKGLQIPSEEVIFLTHKDGNPLQRDGNPVEFWPTSQRTAHFLDRFSPADGWQVVVENAPGPFSFPDYNVGIDMQPRQLPSVLFTAKLIQYGQVMASRSVLALISTPGSWAGGETSVIGRLYDALGLPGYQRPMQDDDVLAAPKTSNSLAKVMPPTFKLPAPVTAETTPVDVAVAAAVKAASAPLEAQPVTVEANASPHDEPGDQESKVPEVATDNRAINRNLLQQITTQAAIKGVTVPMFASDEEAKGFLKQLYRTTQYAGSGSESLQ